MKTLFILLLTLVSLSVGAQSTFPPTYKGQDTERAKETGATYKTRDGVVHQLFTGPRGGKYYINSKGNKVYPKLPK